MFGGLPATSNTSSAFNPALRCVDNHPAGSPVLRTVSEARAPVSCSALLQTPAPAARYSADQVADTQHPLGRPAWIRTLLARKDAAPAPAPAPAPASTGQAAGKSARKKTAGAVSAVRRLGRRLHLLSHGMYTANRRRMSWPPFDEHMRTLQIRSLRPWSTLGKGGRNPSPGLVGYRYPSYLNKAPSASNARATAAAASPK
jgi:hypothetical protein